MNPIAPNDVCIVGCGRWLQCDDQAGLRAAESLSMPLATFACIRWTESPTVDIPNWLEFVELLIVIDAAKADKLHPPGTVERIDYRQQSHRLHSRPGNDIHSLGVDVALKVAESLGILPPAVWIYVIAVENGRRGEHMSRVVSNTISKVTDLVMHDVQEWRMGQEVHHA